MRGEEEGLLLLRGEDMSPDEQGPLLLENENMFLLEEVDILHPSSQRSHVWSTLDINACNK